MKPLGSGAILKSETVTAVECLRYALTLPTSVVITGCESIRILDQAIDAALDFAPYSAVEKEALLARTAFAAKNGNYELFKTTAQHDGTVRNPKWLERAEI